MIFAGFSFWAGLAAVTAVDICLVLVLDIVRAGRAYFAWPPAINPFFTLVLDIVKT